MPTLQFKGKTFVQNHHLAVKYHQLVPRPELSLTEKVSLHDNLIIHGDNLIALKALLPTYSGRVKCIYIDPPYNTGNEGWAYNDNVKSPMLQEWLGKVVDKEDLTRHDKWLCMMMPRLKLLRELLLLKEGRMWFGTDGLGMPRRKTYLFEREGSVPWTWWTNKEAGHNQEARKEIIEILGSSDSFDTPKPSILIKRILQIASDENSIVLDSFAGSGTTAQAVLEINKEDGGNRKFILIEQEKYSDNVTAERVRKVIKGVESSKDENLKNGVGGTFSYFELGPAIEMENILRGDSLPIYNEFARYIFFTATGNEFDQSAVNEQTGFIGETKNAEVYMFYKPDIEWLKRNALTLDLINALPKYKGKHRLVFAPAKYVDDQTCLENRIDFCQLPYEIYRIQS